VIIDQQDWTSAIFNKGRGIVTAMDCMAERAARGSKRPSRLAFRGATRSSFINLLI